MRSRWRALLVLIGFAGIVLIVVIASSGSHTSAVDSPRFELVSFRRVGNLYLVPAVVAFAALATGVILWLRRRHV